jgi:hypothetical protein
LTKSPPFNQHAERAVTQAVREVQDALDTDASMLELDAASI